MPITQREIQMLDRVFGAARNGNLQSELARLRRDGYTDTELDRPYGRIMERLLAERETRNPND